MSNSERIENAIRDAEKALERYESAVDKLDRMARRYRDACNRTDAARTARIRNLEK
jgi:hypothetical protein